MASVLVLLDRLTYSRAVLTGLAAQRRLTSAWRLRVVDPGSWDGQGGGCQAIVGLMRDARTAELVAACGVPAVSVSSIFSAPFPTVCPDAHGTGFLAGSHLADRGIRSAIHVASADRPSHASQGKGLLQSLRKRFADAQVCEIRVGDIPATVRAIQAQAAACKATVGVVCCSDALAVALSESASHQAIGSPAGLAPRLAIISADADNDLGAAAEPAVTWIRPDGERVGWEAAALVQRLLDGQAVPNRPLLIPPAGVIARASTAVHGMADQPLAEVLRLMEEHPAGDLAAIARRARISRSSLERGFARRLGCTPGALIRKQRIERALQLMAEGQLGVAAIASRAGFRTLRHFRRCFRAATGLSPGQWRLVHAGQ